MTCKGVYRKGTKRRRPFSNDGSLALGDEFVLRPRRRNHSILHYTTVQCIVSEETQQHEYNFPPIIRSNSKTGIILKGWTSFFFRTFPLRY